VLLRVIRDEPGPAAWNMAVDEALLSLAAVPTLRLYGWQPHAVSLGYFQRLADFADVPAGTPIVRRLTGGGAIHHGDEITFSLALDATCLPPAVADGYRVLHDAAVAALTRHGITSHRLDSGDPPGARPAQRWCFAEPGRDDVVTERGKLLGSAQRRVRVPRPRLLHHGSLVVHRPALTPFAGALADAATWTEPAAAAVCDSLVAELAKALALRPEPGVLTAAERAATERLVVERYDHPAFLRSR
jgi:lipoyl(octanoyl) transferase